MQARHHVHLSLAGAVVTWAVVLAISGTGSRGEVNAAPAGEPAVAAVPAPAPSPPAPAPKGKAKKLTPQQQQAQAPGQGYVGDDTCLTCHADQEASVKHSAHGRVFNPRTPAANQGCESCHGPGQAHVDDDDKGHMLKFAQMDPADVNESCLTCHTRGKHALWEGSSHDVRNLGCTSCHSAHDSKSASAALKARDEQKLCATCHQSVVNKQHRFNHMPVREGKMTCSSCHNVHGSTNVRLLKVGTTIDESCVSCHAEKRGPFIWEHAPVSDSCTNCHDPHGSNNDRMLVAKQPFLCQRCHVTSRHPPTVYEGYLLQNSQNGNKIFGKACANCHQQIHGSNAPSGKAFLR
jgi:DmsE family decaheme c-type cytochrome